MTSFPWPSELGEETSALAKAWREFSLLVQSTGDAAAKALLQDLLLTSPRSTTQLMGLRSRALNRLINDAEAPISKLPLGISSGLSRALMPKDFDPDLACPFCLSRFTTRAERDQHSRTGCATE